MEKQTLIVNIYIGFVKIKSAVDKKDLFSAWKLMSPPPQKKQKHIWIYTVFNTILKLS